jgi:transglutaminase-like putative cysteine protease
MMFLKKTQKEVGVKHKAHFNLNPKNAWFLWLCQCLNVAAIALELSTWMLGIISLSLAWQALLLNSRRGVVHSAAIPAVIPAVTGKKDKAHRKTQNTTVSPILLGGFAVLGCIAIAVTAKTAGILVSMLHLLCFSYVLKALELRKRSDFYQLLLLGLFILASTLIFRQDLAFTLLIFALLLINLAVLLQFFSFEQAFAVNIKVVALLLVQSTLLAVVLFLVFPRLSPFWQVPLAKSAETGLSDTVKPGDIANLTRSTKLAFRADFGQQQTPLYSQLYWRAMVLEDYDGKQWTSNKTNKKPENSRFSEEINSSINKADVTPLSYQVTVEPSFQKYLFALAPAIKANNQRDINAGADYTFTSSKMITQVKSYQLSSYLSLPLAKELSNKSRKINLHYPQGSNPRLEQMATQLQQDYIDVEQRAQAVLSLIREQQYSYTLQPPLLQNNSLDQFFFDTKAGFCVHYASSFTFLMRASGIPARMVTGYLGGEFNEASNADESGNKGHLSIYQYDAHAWSEIWVQGKGWLRIDPTGAVDPERVDSGWSTQLLQQQSSLSNDLVSLYRFKNSAWLNAIRLQFDALDYQWTRWVVSFSSDQQYNLLKSLFGNMAPWKLTLIIAVSLITSMLMLMFFLQLLNRPKVGKQPKKAWQLIYLKALGKLAKHGIDKPTDMTVNSFAKEVRAQSPELAIVFTQLSANYNNLSYQVVSPQVQAQLIVKMQQQYRQLIQELKKNS